MYPGNSQYFSSQQVPQNTQLPSGYIQQLPQNYRSMQVSALSQLQQQSAALQQSAGYQAHTNQAINASRIHSKPAASQQRDHLQNLSTQSSSWIPNGTLSMQHVQQAQPQSSQRWQQHIDQQQLLQGQRVNHNQAQTNQTTIINSPQVLPRSVMDFHTANLRQNVRNQPNQLNAISQTLQQSQTSRVLPQRLPSSTMNSNLSLLQPERLAQAQRQSINRSVSVPSNNARMQAPSNVLHSSSIPSQDLSSLIGHNARQSMQNIGTMQPKGASQQPEKRDKIHIRFDQKSKQKSVQPSPPQQMRHLSKQSDSESSAKDEEDSHGKLKTPLVLENNTRIVIDDDIEIVGTKEAEIMSHIRSDCPVYPYKRVERVDLPPIDSNIKCCSKCFCYICDKLAQQCDSWKSSISPHCNANTKSSCWKARRNIKTSPLMNLLTPDEITSELSQAGETAIKYIVRIREAYITYRGGIPCEFHLVPCECSCHRANKLSKDACAQCKAVHDMKKKFNYEPVRQVVLQIVQEIVKEYSDKPYSALILFDALLSELCSHRPADFNHVTRMPSNPDSRCQCNTPQIMDEHIDWELIKLFTLYEIQPKLKEKFLQCVNAAVQPLQLKDIMKRFLQMRHWDDSLLRSVLMTQVGRRANADVLKEQPLIIELRVNKLSREEKFLPMLQYLKTVKASKAAKNSISDGAPIGTAIEKWSLECLAKLGYFCEACITLPRSIGNLPVKYVLNMFSLLSGKGLPTGTELVFSFNQPTPSPYVIVGRDKTILLLVYLMFMERNTTAQSDFSCYLWLAKWLNEEKIEHEQDKTIEWMKSSSKLIEWGRKVFSLPYFQQQLRQCQPISPQAALFTCSSLIIQFLKKTPNNMSYIPEVIEAYKNNEWALFYMFSQPSLLSCGNHHLISWMTNFMKSTGNTLSQFNIEAFRMLIENNNFMDVCSFMQQWISPVWISHSLPFVEYFMDISAKFAQKIVAESGNRQHVKASEWFADVVLAKIVDNNIHLKSTLLLQLCEVVGYACCYLNMKHLTLYKRLLLPPGSMSNGSMSTDNANILKIFAFYQDKFNRNSLTPEEIADLARYAMEESNDAVLLVLFNHYTDKHQCPEPGATSILLMEEVISSLNSSQVSAMKKENLISLYARLCAHETLSWLICAKCSSNMPTKWMELWKALADSNMHRKLYEVVEQTLHQFAMWIKDLCALEENDMKRLLSCLNIFIDNVANTLVHHCKFDVNVLKDTIFKTCSFVANPQLQHDYSDIIHRVFDALKEQLNRKNNVVTTQERVVLPATPVQEPVSHEAVSTAANSVQNKTPANKEENIKASVRSTEPKLAEEMPLSNSDKLAQKAQTTTASQPTLSTQSPSQPSHSPLKLTINKSRLSSSSEVTHTSALPDKSISSPPLGSPTAACPQCGDPMTSSFRCSKCHVRKSVDVRCPNCSQVNHDLKGYACRYCYASLLEVLTRGETKAPESTPTLPKHEPEKKRKKLKRKRTEDALKSPPPPTKTSKIHPEPEAPEVNPPRIKTSIQKDKEDHFSVKPASPSRDTSKTHQRSVISKISVDDLTPQPPKPHQRAKEAQQKERPHSKHHPPKQDRSAFSSVRDTPTLSESDSDDEEEQQHQVPPLILRRKSDAEPTSTTVPERKVVQSEQSPNIPLAKKSHGQGNSMAMSKKQRNILQRMKNVGRQKHVPKQPKNNVKGQAAASTEWEVQKRRKPGPKSKTSYYSINQNWAIPRNNNEMR